MLAFAHMMHLFPHKFACLSGRRFAFSGVLMSAFQRFLFRHILISSPGCFLKEMH
jgi:hypothetical protein